jgi:hypothetical protein
MDLVAVREYAQAGEERMHNANRTAWALQSRVEFLSGGCRGGLRD